MEFNISFDGKDYMVEPIGTEKVSYRVRDESSSYNIKLDSTGEWICDTPHFEQVPIPVDEIGKEIEKFFG